MRWIEIILVEESDEAPDRAAGIGPRPPARRGYQKGTSRRASQASPASPARMIRLMTRMMYSA